MIGLAGAPAIFLVDIIPGELPPRRDPFFVLPES